METKKAVRYQTKARKVLFCITVPRMMSLLAAVAVCPVKTLCLFPYFFMAAL